MFLYLVPVNGRSTDSLRGGLACNQLFSHHASLSRFTGAAVTPQERVRPTFSYDLETAPRTVVAVYGFVISSLCAPERRCFFFFAQSLITEGVRNIVVPEKFQQALPGLIKIHFYAKPGEDRQRISEPISPAP